jgi:hypothetical protein
LVALQPHQSGLGVTEDTQNPLARGETRIGIVVCESFRFSHPKRIHENEASKSARNPYSYWLKSP